MIKKLKNLFTRLKLSLKYIPVVALTRETLDEFEDGKTYSITTLVTYNKKEDILSLRSFYVAPMEEEEDLVCGTNCKCKK